MADVGDLALELGPVGHGAVVELRLIRDESGGHEAMAWIVVGLEQLLERVADDKVEFPLGLPDRPVKEVRHRILNPAHKRDVRGERVPHHRARVVDQHD